MWSLSLVMSERSLSGRGQGHVRLLHCGLRKFQHSKSSVYRWYTQLDRRRFVYDTYKTMKVTRMHHGWVHMFITHQPTLNLQLHDFDLFRTCRTSSFCTVAWQLARFQLTRRIVRSLGDSWTSCTFLAPAHPGSPGQKVVKRVCVYSLTECQYSSLTNIISYNPTPNKVDGGANCSNGFWMHQQLFYGYCRSQSASAVTVS